MLTHHTAPSEKATTYFHSSGRSARARHRLRLPPTTLATVRCRGRDNLPRRDTSPAAILRLERPDDTRPSSLCVVVVSSIASLTGLVVDERDAPSDATDAVGVLSAVSGAVIVI
jgi:hypothetical protein